MKGVSPEMAPVSLLYYGDNVPNRAQELLDKSQSFRRGLRWIQAERYARSALEFCQQGGGDSEIGVALAQIHLADILSDVGEVGEALRMGLEAWQILAHRVEAFQNHNEAVALYTVGLLYQQQFLGEASQALYHYQKALTEFEAALRYWRAHIDQLEQEDSREVYLSDLRRLLFTSFDQAELKSLFFCLHINYDRLPGEDKIEKVEALVDRLENSNRISKLVEVAKQQRPHLPWDEPQVNDRGKASDEAERELRQLKSYHNRCQQACQWVEERSNRIMESRTGQVWRPLLDIWAPDDVNGPFPVGRYAAGYILSEDRVEIAGRSYISDVELEPDNGHYCFALPVTDIKLMPPGAQESDYVLIRQQWNVREQQEDIRPGVMWLEGESWFAVDFRREPKDGIKFYRRVPKKRRIIGADRDPIGKIKGYVIAILRPEG